MSLLFRSKPERRAVDLNAWARGADVSISRSFTGEAVNFDTVIGLDAVAAAVGLLSDVVYMLPASVFSDQVGAADPKVSPTPPIVARPSLTVDARVWRSQAIVSWLLWGNVYGLVLTRDRLGRPETVEWLDPTTVTVLEESSIRPARYQVSGVDVPPDQIIHVPGRYVRPGTRVGIAPLARFTETFGLALAARNYGARWFGEGAHPSAILKSDQAISQEQASTIKDRFLSATRGKREPAVLGAGVDYQSIQSNPQETQLSETQSNAVVAVARAFGLPPEMIAAAVSGQSVTYANREQRAIDFLTFSVDPWLVRFEDFWTSNLPRPQYAKFNRGALLRSDLMTRYRAHDVGIRAGWLNRNEARDMEERGPIEDGDQFLWPPYRTTVIAEEE